MDDVPGMLRKIAEWATNKRGIGTVILVPAGFAAQPWTSVADYADSTQKAAS